MQFSLIIIFTYFLTTSKVLLFQSSDLRIFLAKIFLVLSVVLHLLEGPKESKEIWLHIHLHEQRNLSKKTCWYRSGFRYLTIIIKRKFVKIRTAILLGTDFASWSCSMSKVTASTWVCCTCSWMSPSFLARPTARVC